MSAYAEYKWAKIAYLNGEITAAELADAEASVRYEAEQDDYYWEEEDGEEDC